MQKSRRTYLGVSKLRKKSRSKRLIKHKISLKPRNLTRGGGLGEEWMKKKLENINKVITLINSGKNKDAVSLYNDIVKEYYHDNDEFIKEIIIPHDRSQEYVQTGEMLKKVKERIVEIEPMILEIEELNPGNIGRKSIENVRKLLDTMNSKQINHIFHTVYPDDRYQTLLHAVVFDLPAILGDYSFANPERGYHDGYDAQQQKDIQNLTLLLSKGADPNIGDNLGRTPLFYVNCAFLRDEDNKYTIEKKRILLENNANPDIEDKYGKTPIDYVMQPSTYTEAQIKEHPKKLEKLLRKNDNLGAKTILLMNAKGGRGGRGRRVRTVRKV
jgi:hypothetical protein